MNELIFMVEEALKAAPALDFKPDEGLVCAGSPMTAIRPVRLTVAPSPPQAYDNFLQKNILTVTRA